MEDKGIGFHILEMEVSRYGRKTVSLRFVLGRKEKQKEQDNGKTW